MELDADAEVWILLPSHETARPLCGAFFRDECANRRCRWSHAATIAGLRRPKAHHEPAATEPALRCSQGAPTLLCDDTSPQASNWEREREREKRKKREKQETKRESAFER